MSAIETENQVGKPDPKAALAKSTRKTDKKAKAAKQTPRPKRAATPKTDRTKKTDRTNKKAAVIALMKRTKGATLSEIMKTTGWQPHTVRGFVSILGGKGGENIESSKSADGERTYRIAK